ncbi:MAG: phage holin family protein [Actinobacteria bacterium]|nr:phage holin family protein [Actinomycetota bacterium]
MSVSTSPPARDATSGELVSRLTSDLSTLIRDELRLAQVETTAKAKKAGLGLGLLGGAGVIAGYGTGALIAAAILGLATAMHAWLAALIVGVVLLVVAGLAALMGRRNVSAATPPMPTEAVQGIKSDVQTLREGVRR